MLNERNGQQPGDPDKAAAAMFALTQLQNPPVHVPLGEYAYSAGLDKLDELKTKFSQFEYIVRPTDS